MSTLQLEAQPRELVGRKVKQIRRQGLVPVVVYGSIDQPLNLQIPERTLERTLHDGGNSQLIQLGVEGGETHNVLMRDLQRHPVRRTLLHVDFYAINMRDKQQLSVPVISVNNPTTLVGGMMVLQAMDNVEIEALPGDIPASIEVDITDLDLDKPITVADLPALNGVDYLSSPEEPIFTMAVSRITEEAIAAEDAAIGEASADAAADADGDGEEAEEESADE